MSSSRRNLIHQQEMQQQFHHLHPPSIGKLKNLSATLSFVVILVGFSFFVYLRSFIALHESLQSAPSSRSPSSSSSLSLETWVVIWNQNPQHRSTIENVSLIPLPPGDVIVTPDADFLRKNTTSDESSGEFPDGSEIPAELPAGSPKSDETLPNTTTRDSDSYAEEAAELVEQDLQELLKIFAGSKRRQWLKQHWSEIRILQSDKTSELFARRIKRFLKNDAAANSSSSRSCSQTFFTIWISSVEGFGEREIRCLESIFKHHPDACVVVVSRSLDSLQGAELLQPFNDRGFRVMAAAPDLPYLFAGTPAQPWLKNLKKGKVDPGEISFKQNLSNILRLLLVYKFGGIYLDSDVLLLNSFANLSNAIGAQNEDSRSGDWFRLNNAVLVFGKQHPTVHSFIKEFALTFNGSKWGHNGPYLATRVLMRLRIANSGRGVLGCTVLRTRAFYPVSWSHIPSLFKRPRTTKELLWKEAKLQRLTTESYSIHLWNKETRGLEVQPGSVIDELFRSQCVLCDEPAAVGVAR